ncbi:MAG: AtpZ/AtpI family protein [Chloroflexi bacterium]|nr:AtpZ/AtpI family protein [Chloroflexota bacterium]
MRRWELALQLIGMGWYVGTCILLGVLGGLWLDSKLGTTPLMVIVGLLAGIFVAFYGVYRMILPNISKNNQKRNKGKR